MLKNTNRDGDEHVKASNDMEDAAYGGAVSAAQSSPVDINGCSTVMQESGIKKKAMIPHLHDFSKNKAHHILIFARN
ncbi:hypothetical protein L2E82_51868 [Cichorium intybus]|nr:hypothetical protein L2E82_51868 [Cichorium intybus]